jgi:hypothetical protein
MRAIVPTLILNQTRPRLHGARVTFFASHNNSVGRFEQHVATHGRPFACVLAKFDSPELRGACQSLGALTLLDCIDNYRCFSHSGHHTPHMREYDSILVQTRAHASILAKQNVSVVVRANPACPPARQPSLSTLASPRRRARVAQPLARVSGLSRECDNWHILCAFIACASKPSPLSLALARDQMHCSRASPTHACMQVYPHPHGDHGLPCPPPPVRPSVQNVGFVFSDPQVSSPLTHILPPQTRPTIAVWGEAAGTI